MLLTCLLKKARLFGSSSHAIGRPRARRSRLGIEFLEGRLVPAGLTQQEVLIERHATLDALTGNGLGYSQYTDSSPLAWGESYILSSYLGMHEGTEDTRYLDKFVDHADRIRANARDTNRDGYEGWGSYDSSANLARNNGFETASSIFVPSLPKDWTRSGSTSTTAYRDSTQKYAGSYGATLRTNPSKGAQILETATFNGLVKDNQKYEPNTLYQLSFYGKTNGSAAGGRVEVYDYTSRITLAAVSFTNTAWANQTLTFWTPAAGGHDVRLRLTHKDPKVSGGTAWFDEVKVRQYAEFTVHDGMITAPMARFAAIVKADPALSAAVVGGGTTGPTYGQRAVAYTDFIRTNIVPKWEPLFRPIGGGTAGVYINPDDGSTIIPGSTLPHNQYLSLGRTFLWLAAAPDAQPADSARATALGNAFKSKLQIVGGAYNWNYYDPFFAGDYAPVSPIIEDTSHGNADIGFASTANQLGMVFTDADMARFVTTFTDVMWNQSWSEPKVFSRVNGTGDFTYTEYLHDWAGLATHAGENDVWAIANAAYEYQAPGATAGLWSTGSSSTAMLTISQLVNGLTHKPMLSNGSFETSDLVDPTLPQGWIRPMGTTANTAKMSSGFTDSGLTILPGPEGKPQVVEQALLNYRGDTAYSITFWSRGNGTLDVYDATTSTVLSATTQAGETVNGWTKYTTTFTSPVSAGHNLRLRLTNAGLSTADWDEISIVQSQI